MPRASRRRPDRWGRDRQLRRPGARRADARGPLQSAGTRDRQPPHVHDLLRRRPAGGHLCRGVFAGRSLGLGRLIAYLRRQPHLDRGRHRRSRSARTSAPRYEAYGWHVQNLGEDLSLERIEQATERGAGRHRQAVADRLPHPHRPGVAEQAGHRGAHGSPLGEEEVTPDQGGIRLAERAGLLRPARGPRPRPRRRSTGGASSRPTGTRGSPPTAAEHPDLGEELRPDRRAPGAGRPREPARSASRPIRWSRPARPPSGASRRPPRSIRHWSAGRPTWLRRT